MPEPGILVAFAAGSLLRPARRRTAEAEAQVAAILRQRPDFSIAEFLRRDILLEREEDREHLREGLIKAGLPP